EGAKLMINGFGDAAEIERECAELGAIHDGADMSKPAEIDAMMKRCADELGGPDILVNNAGGPPPGDFRNWTRDDWIKAIDANMLTPIELIKATVDGMMARKFGRIVNITSAAVKAPIDILGLSNGARSGLTGFVAGLARSRIAARGVTINGLLPGAFDTDRLRATMQGAAAKTGKTIEQVADERRRTIPAQRLGSADEFGAVCAFLCSVQAGYITGQNVLADGGAYPGTF
ncbi:MAG TPA: SDR family oxidoreductase, partial [Casimicrobiaceae bacterium]